MTLFFATIGPVADYQTFGKWLLLISTTICWVAQFASISLTCELHIWNVFKVCSKSHINHNQLQAVGVLQWRCTWSVSPHGGLLSHFLRHFSRNWPAIHITHVNSGRGVSRASWLPKHTRRRKVLKRARSLVSARCVRDLGVLSSMTIPCTIW